MSPHAYASGNYTPVREERALSPCRVLGIVPKELAGGMYVRNGSNPNVPVHAPGNGKPRPYHWFDGDGMLQGVFFSPAAAAPAAPAAPPSFVNRYVLTDINLATSTLASSPILPSIATLLGPVWLLPMVVCSVLRAVFLAARSFATMYPVRRLSVANTSVLWHDGRALVGCESGPLGWVRLPALETVGWWDLEGDEGEMGMRAKGGVLGWMKEWTTAHPKLDPVTGELVLFHSQMLPPYLSYSVNPSTQYGTASTPRITSAPVPLSGPRMMHDFAASHSHSILLDLPLSLDPINLLRGVPIVALNSAAPARFGVLPRHAPEQVRWYTAPSCVIFHTALAFNTLDEGTGIENVHLICCRLNSSRLVYAAGNLALPASQALPAGVEDTCRLHYYAFALTERTGHGGSSATNLTPSHSFPLASIPFEFPTVPHATSMTNAQYVYGCSMRQGSFTTALGSAAKIDCLVKVDVQHLLAQGRQQGNREDEAVDRRSVAQLLDEQEARGGAEGALQVFAFPKGRFGQECSFIPRHSMRGEDDGYLLTYVFDEAQLDPLTGEPHTDAVSELWAIDAWTMQDVVCRVILPQRVPYGLHGNWFTAAQVDGQREVKAVRIRPKEGAQEDGCKKLPAVWWKKGCRAVLEMLT